MSVTLVFITARLQSRFDWLFQSLARCSHREIVTQIVIVDLFAEPFDDWAQPDVERRRDEVIHESKQFTKFHQCEINWIPPKPNAWSGKFRFTPRNWWSKPESLNSGVAMSKNDYLVFSDDRCVFAQTFLDAVKEAMENNYAVCGTYEKRINMKLNNGEIAEHGATDEAIAKSGDCIGQDSRKEVAQGRKMICPGTWMFGHAFGLPLEWMLEVNGVDELWDSVSMEDTAFGQMLENNGKVIYHDPRMAQVQDRTPEFASYDMKRSSKEKHSGDKNDKTHKLIEKLWNRKTSSNGYSLRELRKSVLAGNPFPLPLSPHQDFFDGQKLSEMT